MSSQIQPEPVRRGVAWGGVLLCLLWIGLWGGKPSNAQKNRPPDMVLYDGGMQNAWQDWSWAEHSLIQDAVKYHGKPTLRLVPSDYKALYLHHSTLSLKDYTSLSFAIQGGKEGGQKLIACFADTQDKFGTKVELDAYLPNKKLPADRFVVCTIPLKAFQNEGLSINGLVIQDNSGGKQSPVYLAEIRLLARKPKQQGVEISLEVDASKILGGISPAIYGMAQPKPEHFSELKMPLARWGGNAATRYNWELGNAWNSARDWQFRNGNYGANTPEYRKASSVADKSIGETLQAGADMILTIPTIGWVAKDDNNRSESKNVPMEGGDALSPNSDAIPGYDPTENRKRTSVRSVARKGKPFQFPPDLEDGVVYQDEWVAHLVQRFGGAKHGGVKYYAMDNEPDLWDSTHTDIHPVRMGYQETLQQFLEYSKMVKEVDPSAKILGPVAWGWTGYFFSSKDRGTDNFATHAERKSHDNMPFLPWFLQQVARYDASRGRRTLDYLDIHFYPAAQGVYEGKTDTETNALRLRSVQGLWNPDYLDESWIGTSVQLIPRMQQWIQKYYPGTKLALTEWNWGAETTMNGGIAIAEVLGVLGREHVDMACYWTAPPVASPGFFAWKMYRNADGMGKGFGDTALSANSSDPEKVSLFASTDTKTQTLCLMILNKMPYDTAKITLNIKGKQIAEQGQVYLYSEENPKIIRGSTPLEIKEGKAQLTLPPYSITLVRCR